MFFFLFLLCADLSVTVGFLEVRQAGVFAAEAEPSPHLARETWEGTLGKPAQALKKGALG